MQLVPKEPPTDYQRKQRANQTMREAKKASLRLPALSPRSALKPDKAAKPEFTLSPRLPPLEPPPVIAVPKSFARAARSYQQAETPSGLCPPSHMFSPSIVASMAGLDSQTSGTSVASRGGLTPRAVRPARIN